MKKFKFLIIAILLLFIVFCGCDSNNTAVSNQPETQGTFHEETTLFQTETKPETETETKPETETETEPETETECRHVWKDATCTSPMICSICEATKWWALGHTWTDATCTSPETCSVCNDTKGEALGHTLVIDNAVAPTCIEAGLTEGSHCSVCNKIVKEQEIVGGKHDYVSVQISPTTTEDGYTEYTCSVCGDSYKDNYISAEAFTISSSNKYWIGYTGQDNETLIIPSVFQYEGQWYKVTSIGDYAFLSCDELTNVTIPGSVTSIGDGAFSGCSWLTDVTICEGVTSIGSDAFGWCDELTSITIPRSVKKIDEDAFDGTYRKKVFYAGSVSDWEDIRIHSSNSDGLRTIYYYSENKPSDTIHHYWHYVNGVPTAW